MKKKKGHLGLSNSFHYTLMVLPGYVWLFMFSIVPMVGIVMAFQDYNPSKGWFGSPWVGLKWFKYLTVIPDAKRALVNTLIIAIAKVILNIIIPLVFALLLNEVKNMKFKKTVQTIVYLPHFVSWVILANIITNILGANGIFNTVRSAMGATDTVLPMTMPSIFRQLLIGTDVWKEFGYNAVIYLAALTGISPSLYEAAAIDGASRWKRVWHITIPGLVPTIVLLTTLAMGNVLNAGFDRYSTCTTSWLLKLVISSIHTYTVLVLQTCSSRWLLQQVSLNLLSASCWLLLLMFVLTSLLITRFSKEGRNYDRKQEFWQQSV